MDFTDDLDECVEKRPTLLNWDSLFTFGKYKGQSVREVYHSDPGYIVWCSENIDFVVFPWRVIKASKEAHQESDDLLDYIDFQDTF